MLSEVTEFTVKLMNRSKVNFSYPAYARFRPSYPQELYDIILGYHKGPKNLCVDLGCGHGIVTRSLAGEYSRIIGIDPSQGMITQAENLTDTKKYGNVSYRHSFAEELGFLPNGSVDTIVAGQAAHWFKYDELFPELQRVLRKDGTLAFWGYRDPVWTRYPKATEILHRYAYSTDKEKLGPYWTEPGRTIVEGLLRDIKPPEDLFIDIRREEYDPNSGSKNCVGKFVLRLNLTLKESEEYIRTWSAFHGWQESHPTLLNRAKGGGGDVVDELFDEIKQVEDWSSDTILHTVFGTGLLMARKSNERI